MPPAIAAMDSPMMAMVIRGCLIVPHLLSD
jgi:hypothetical protein